ncbi:hypothetical protein [Pendulispora albinea]|uniref:Uncharacterized protein n=1 Tax=Pendulispora albinea TaxID=2741071 RepID=A0ABZ2M840_9BACT
MLEGSLQVGRDLLPIADLLGERAQINIDGETAWVGSSISRDPIDKILGRFAANCRENGVSEGTWQGLAKESDLAKVDLNRFDLGIIRHEKGNEGMVVCFPKAEETPDGWLNRLAAFERTQDLGSLGRVRYAFVRSDGAQSHILTVWTATHFHLDKLVATDEYEPGMDNPALPRPIRARRTLSASIDGTPYGVRGYISMGTPREIVDAYDTEMKARGFFTVTHGLEPERDARGYVKDGLMVVLGTTPTDDGKSIVSLVEMAADPKVNPAEATPSPRIVD